MFVLELYAGNLHHVLGRLLDRTRVAGLTLTTVSAAAEGAGYRVLASFDVADRLALDIIAQRIGTIVGVGTLQVRQQCSQTPQGVLPRCAELEGATSG